MTDDNTLATQAGESRLEHLLRATGFPLASEPTDSELLQAARQLRRRKRQELMRFLGRIVARSIRRGSELPGKELCRVED